VRTDRQIVWNLLRNAAEAMPSGGTITVAAINAAVPRKSSERGGGMPCWSR
jgi:signal transduction histidine kinase